MPELNSLSRLKTTEPIITDGIETFGRWNMPSFLKIRPSDNNIQIFRVTPALEGRPDLISNQVYGTPFLDWVVIAFNGPNDVLNWPKAGDVIEIPSEDIVLPELL